jgi:hypothetical protein
MREPGAAGLEKDLLRGRKGRAVGIVKAELEPPIDAVGGDDLSKRNEPFGHCAAAIRAISLLR